MQKLKVIVVDDQTVWVDIIRDALNKNFSEKLEIEDFSDFEEAKNRIMNSSKKFDFLITDILNDDNDIEGLTFARYADEIKNRPVIVITAVAGIVKSTYKDYKVIEVFYKPNFEKEKMKFELAVNEAIKEALKRRKDDDGTDNKTNNPEHPEKPPPDYLT